jgi:hypothetical protein
MSKMQEYIILSALVGAVEKIDSGCSHCIGEFVENANWSLGEAESEYFFEYDDIDSEVTIVMKTKEIAESIEGHAETLKFMEEFYKDL